jgi:diguanylate cyclase (GGDEF)-like protein/PAS domain S-box-containing protein
LKDISKTKEQLIEELNHLRHRISELESIASQGSAALDELLNNKKRFEDIAENTLEWLWEIDKDGKYTYASPAVEKILGFKPGEVLNRHFYDLFHPEEREELKTKAFDQFRRKDPFREFINRNLHKNGKTVWISTSGVPVLDEKGNILGYRGADTDITERTELIEALRESEENCRLVTQSATYALTLIDGGKNIVLWNKAGENMFGYSADELIGKPLTILIPERFREAHAKGMKEYFLRENSRFMGHDYEITGLRKDGSEFPIEISFAVGERRGEKYFTGIIRDITERKKLEKKLRDASVTDELTGLFNRRGFLTLAQNQIDIANRMKKNFSLLYLDLNDMKTINDELGHQQGDQALVDIAHILKNSFRRSDIIARVGGDEFIVLLREGGRQPSERAIIEKLQENLKVHNEEAERAYRLSVSTGLIQFDPQHPCTLEELLSRADALMYENKQQYQYEKAGLAYLKTVKREKRIRKRFKIEGEHHVELIVPDNARIKDISIDGICLETRQRLSRNTFYTIRVIYPDSKGEEITFTGVVVWSSFQGNDAKGDHETSSYVTGLRFVGPNESLKNFTKELIHLLG